MIRLFAAIALPEPIGEGLVRRQQGVPGARWRTLAQMHITLRFAGEIAEPVAADWDAELSAIAADRFPLELASVGVFSEEGERGALWAGVAPSEPLRMLAGRCESAARRAGLRPEARVFRPHVTLAYLKRADRGRIAAWIQGHNLLRSPPFTVEAFGLYSSWLGAGGSAYRLERRYDLIA